MNEDDLIIDIINIIDVGMLNQDIYSVKGIYHIIPDVNTFCYDVYTNLKNYAIHINNFVCPMMCFCGGDDAYRVIEVTYNNCVIHIPDTNSKIFIPNTNGISNFSSLTFRNCVFMFKNEVVEPNWYTM